jgi:hypothetical protein
MIRCWPDPFSQSDISYETKLAIRDAQRATLGFQQHLQHSDHVARHFPAVIATPTASFFQLAGVRVRRLRNTNDAGADTATRTINKNVWLNRKGDSLDVDRTESSRLSQGHCPHAKRVFMALEQSDRLNATHCFVASFGFCVEGGPSVR